MLSLGKILKIFNAQLEWKFFLQGSQGPEGDPGELGKPGGVVRNKLIEIHV